MRFFLLQIRPQSGFALQCIWSGACPDKNGFWQRQGTAVLADFFDGLSLLHIYLLIHIMLQFLAVAFRL